MLVRHRRKVRSYVCDCLDAGFLVVGYGCLLSVLLLFRGLAKYFNFLIHVEHLRHFLFETPGLVGQDSRKSCAA